MVTGRSVITGRPFACGSRIVSRSGNGGAAAGAGRTCAPGHNALMSDPALRITLTAHAAFVASERRIRTEWIERVLAAPEAVGPDRLDPALRHAVARIAERGDRVLRVVYDPRAKPIRVVTVFFDRRKRQG